MFPVYRKWSNKRPGRLLNFRGSRGAFNRYEVFILKFVENENEVGLVVPGCYRARTNRKKVAEKLSQEIKKIKERYPYFELDIEQDAVRKPLLVKHEES